MPRIAKTYAVNGEVLTLKEISEKYDISVGQLKNDLHRTGKLRPLYPEDDYDTTNPKYARFCELVFFDRYYCARNNSVKDEISGLFMDPDLDPVYLRELHNQIRDKRNFSKFLGRPSMKTHKTVIDPLVTYTFDRYRFRPKDTTTQKKPHRQDDGILMAGMA